MDYSQFNHTLDMAKPPEDFHDILKALWWERKGEWDFAHNIIQNLHGKDAARVHAYLHRKEGDIGNANYWYSAAGISPSKEGLVEEFRELTKYMLEKLY